MRGPGRVPVQTAGVSAEPAVPVRPAAGSDAVPATGAAVPLSRLVAAFFAARRPRKESPHTTAAYRRDLAGVAALAAAHRGVDPDQLGLADLDRDTLRAAFGAHADAHAAASVLRAWSAWNQFFTFCVADGFTDGNPMASVARPRRPSRHPKPLRGEDTPEELLRRVAAGGTRPDRGVPGGRRDPWPERDLAVLGLALVTGLRSAELLTLTVGALAGRPGERRVHVVGKGGKSRSVPVEAGLEAVLEDYLASRRGRFPRERPGRESPLFVDRHGTAMRRGGLQYLVRSAYREAGLHDRVPDGANVHALRHTFATRLAEDGATASEIMALLGHASIATSQGYIDATTREQRAAAAANRTYRVLEDLGAPGAGAAGSGGSAGSGKVGGGNVPGPLGGTP